MKRFFLPTLFLLFLVSLSLGQRESTFYFETHETEVIPEVQCALEEAIETYGQGSEQLNVTANVVGSESNEDAESRIKSVRQILEAYLPNIRVKSEVKASANTDHYVSIQWMEKVVYSDEELTRGEESIEKLKANLAVTPVIKKEFNGRRKQSVSTSFGTQLVVPAKSFVRADGSVPEVVRVEFQEYQKLSDILTANLQTATTDGRLLETGGMYTIAATDENGQELQLAKKLELDIPLAEHQRQGMQLFYGVETDAGTEWELAPVSSNSLSMRSTSPGANKQVRTNSSTAAPTRSSGVTPTRSSTTRNSPTRTSPTRTSPSSTSTTTRSSSSWDFPSTSTSSSSSSNSTCTSSSSNSNTGKGLIIAGGALLLTAIIIKAATAPSSDEGRAVLSIADLRPINCDRFVNTGRPLTRMTVNVPAGATEVFCIYDNYRSVITRKTRSGQVSIPNAPIGEPVTILAINSAGESLRLAEERTRVDNSISDMQFEEVTSDEFKSRIEALDF